MKVITDREWIKTHFHPVDGCRHVETADDVHAVIITESINGDEYVCKLCLPLMIHINSLIGDENEVSYE